MEESATASPEAEGISTPAPEGEDTRVAYPWKLTLCYDGAGYFGWQVQPGLRTVQGVLAEVVRDVTGESVLPQGSGRTDTGVHAEGQVVSLPLRAAIPPDRLLRALNRRLPADVRVLSVEDAGPDFHARANVLWKTYDYRIFERRVSLPGSNHERARDESLEERICSPFVARYAWDCRWPLDLERLQQAAAALCGTHDFTSFAATSPDRATREEDRQPRSPVRTIFSSEWFRADGLLHYRVTGNGFLHHMVRNIVGTCVEAGSGRCDPASIPHILEQRQRSAAGFTAPPQGLRLMHVQYKSAQPETTAEPVR